MPSFSPGDRAAIIMTNQSKWLISAYAIFHGGGVLVPLDYKLTAAEHLQLLAHCKAKFLVIEYYLVARHHAVAGGSRITRCKPFWSPKLRRVRILPARALGRFSPQG